MIIVHGIAKFILIMVCNLFLNTFIANIFNCSGIVYFNNALSDASIFNYWILSYFLLTYFDEVLNFNLIYKLTM